MNFHLRNTVRMKIIKAIRVLLVTLAACLCLTGFSQTTNTTEPRVAVFVEDGFPAYGGTPALRLLRWLSCLSNMALQCGFCQPRNFQTPRC